jgi:hypothetical protein
MPLTFYNIYFHINNSIMEDILDQSHLVAQNPLALSQLNKKILTDFTIWLLEIQLQNTNQHH